MSEFDYAKSIEAAENGMSFAARNQLSALEMARRIAVEMANRYGTANADDVGLQLIERGYPATGPWAGSIFKGDQWIFTGDRVRSKRISNHGRELKVWRLAQ